MLPAYFGFYRGGVLFSAGTGAKRSHSGILPPPTKRKTIVALDLSGDETLPITNPQLKPDGASVDSSVEESEPSTIPSLQRCLPPADSGLVESSVDSSAMVSDSPPHLLWTPHGGTSSVDLSSVDSSCNDSVDDDFDIDATTLFDDSTI